MSACDLSMLPLEHKHVSQLAQGLHLLQHLDMSGCKKLQPSMTKRLLQGLASKQLQSLNLQRCFQLTDQCLTDVLEYACGSHSSSKALQCIALSHLNLAAWPAAAAADASADSNNDDNNSSSGSSSTVSGSDESGDACAASVMNNFAADAAGSTAAQWGDVAGALLYKLPKQLGAPLLSTGSTAALRMVVLSNCNMLTVSGLVSLAVACPQLEYLFLGGSTLKSPEVLAAGAAGLPAAGVYVPRSVAAAAAAAGDDRVRLGSASELPGALQQLSELLQLPRTLPWEVLSSCCDTDNCSSGCGHCICCCTCCSSARSRAQQRGDSGREASDAEQRARKRLHRNEPSAAAVAAARGHALSLTYVAALLPGLKALEVTFMAPGLAGWLRVCLDRLAHLGQHHQQQHMSSPNSLRLRSSMGLSGVLERTDSGSSSSSSRSDTFGAGASSSRSMLAAGSLLAAGSPRPKVWQFSCATAVADALQTLSAVRRAHRAADSGSNGSDADSSASTMLSPDCLAMAVKCAVNCSSRGRSTPLHMAADAGCACHIRALVAAGAAVAARDASGASALFVACESGQAAAASVLLGAGADALVGNTAGETPLYIAALRGHLSVVELLLGHLSAADVDWTQRQLYGDAWTPLMAAAVANRVSKRIGLGLFGQVAALPRGFVHNNAWHQLLKQFAGASCCCPAALFFYLINNPWTWNMGVPLSGMYNIEHVCW